MSGTMLSQIVWVMSFANYCLPKVAKNCQKKKNAKSQFSFKVQHMGSIFWTAFLTQCSNIKYDNTIESKYIQLINKYLDLATARSVFASIKPNIFVYICQ